MAAAFAAASVPSGRARKSERGALEASHSRKLASATAGSTCLVRVGTWVGVRVRVGARVRGRARLGPGVESGQHLLGLERVRLLALVQVRVRVRVP